MAFYKILTSITENYHGVQSKHFKQVTFDELLEIKGIKTFRRTPGQDRAARARLVSNHVFKGVEPLWDRNGKDDHLPVPLEELGASGNTAAYAKAWRKINHLTN